MDFGSWHAWYNGLQMLRPSSRLHIGGEGEFMYDMMPLEAKSEIRGSGGLNPACCQYLGLIKGFAGGLLRYRRAGGHSYFDFNGMR